MSPGNIIAEDGIVPPAQTSLRVQHMGDPGTAEREGKIANEVSWYVGQFTGFDARAFPAAQRGYRDEPGTSAFQMYCDEAGFFINSWTFSHHMPVSGAGPSVSMARDVIPELQAWRRWRREFRFGPGRNPRSRGQAPAIPHGPVDYGIVSFGIPGEVFPGTGDANNVSLGASVKGLTLRQVPLPWPPERSGALQSER